MDYFLSYWKRLQLRRGIDLDIQVTYRCPFHCGYCIAQLAGRGVPKVKEKSVDEWISYINKFPSKIKNITIDGGEPTLYANLPLLVNRILDMGYFITINTTLFDTKKMTEIKSSPRLMIAATCHIEDDPARFNIAYQKLIPQFQIAVGEFKMRRLKYSRLIEMRTTLDYTPRFVVSPDFKLYTSCAEHYIDRAKRFESHVLSKGEPSNT